MLIKGKRWDRLGPKAFVSKEPVGKGTPVMGPIDKPVHSPDSKQPVPVAESTRKDPTVYSNVPLKLKTYLDLIQNTPRSLLHLKES